MKINIELNTKSIDEAIKKLKFIEKQYTNGKMINHFLERVCDWLISRANMYVENSDIGDNVKVDIKTRWDYTINNGKAKIINPAEKAVFVEFGVGEIGEYEPHPNSAETKYEYNVDSPAKDENGVWHFYTNMDDLDLPKRALNYDTKFFQNDKRGRLYVSTRGAEGVMYAYNALIDARNDLQNPNGELAQIWRTIQKQYIERYMR